MNNVILYIYYQIYENIHFDSYNKSDSVIKYRILLLLPLLTLFYGIALTKTIPFSLILLNLQYGSVCLRYVRYLNSAFLSTQTSIDAELCTKP